MTSPAPSLAARAGGWAFAAAAPICARLAALESQVASDAIAGIEVRQPVFIAGLARSGSTIQLEALASCTAFASMRYGDYPAVWFPYWWTHLRARLPLPNAPAQERAHADGIAVTPDSPEAFDEIFWMHFFRGRHDPTLDQRLDGNCANPAFERFYPLHIRKLLAARGRPRYLCKGNYNLARLPYLRRLFPDARFVVPVRAPLAHVASLCKQHRLFADWSAQTPSVGVHLARTGHFEFGPQRRAECLGDAAAASQIEADFAVGRDVAGYARQWAHSYGALASLLSADRALAEATLIVRFEDLCNHPAATLQRLGAHCALNDDDRAQLVARWADQLRAPTYYRAPFDAADRATIATHCDAVARQLGYDEGS